ncbi:MAG: MFS transporter [Stellaceae bacterium]
MLKPQQTGRVDRFPDSIESPASWAAAAVTLAILSIALGGPLVIVVGLKPIAASLGTDRSTVALASSLTWIGIGLGGIAAGRIADRIGVRWTVIFGAVMAAAGLALSATGRLWALEFGQGALIGLLGNAALNPPLIVYITRWFDRRRGIAVALISSGRYVAGVVWPWVFERGIAEFGWQATMLGYAAVVALAVVPMAFLLRPLPPAARPSPAPARRHRHRARVVGLKANQAQLLLCTASFLCCVPMAIPFAHLVAFCSDLGIAPAQGAAMLSVLLGGALISRPFWGWLTDRIGGLRTIFVGSALEGLAMIAFTLTRSEAGLFVVSAAFGLGFSGLIPAYVLAIRELFPATEASWRIPTELFASMCGMAFGTWFAGAVYDRLGFYAPAFAAGALFNLANLAVISFLIVRQAHSARVAAA